MTSTAPEEVNDPQNKEEMIERIDQSWNRLATLIADYDEQQLIGPQDTAGWTIKDHLSHLTVWERGMLLLFRDHQPQYVGLGIDRALLYAEDFDAINGAIKAQSEGQSLAEIMAERQQVHAELCAVLGSLSEEDLSRPYSYFDPTGDDDPIYIRINGSTWEHYDEHYDWIAAILDAPTSD